MRLKLHEGEKVAAPCLLESLTHGSHVLCAALPHAGYAAAQASAVAEAIKDALCCGCPAAPATAQALSQAIATAGGCKGGISDALAGMALCCALLYAWWCLTRNLCTHHAMGMPWQ